MQRILFSTGVFIHKYLLQHEEAYVEEIYRAFVKEKKEWIGWNNQPLKTGSYQSFRNYVWWLRKLGLIEFSREGPSSNPTLQARRYYVLTKKGKEGLDLFNNPRRYLYAKSWKRCHLPNPENSH